MWVGFRNDIIVQKKRRSLHDFAHSDFAEETFPSQSQLQVQETVVKPNHVQ